MRRIFTLILLFPLVASGATEYLRPTSSAKVAISDPCGVGDSSANYYPPSSAVYSGKTGVGPTGSSVSYTGASDSDVSDETFAAVFKPWAASTLSNTTLVLNANWKCTYTRINGKGASCRIYYSTNSGQSWTSLAIATNSTTVLATTSVTITGTPTAALQVEVCGYGNAGIDDGTGTIYDDSAVLVLYDIWTTGAGTTVPTGTATRQPGVQVISHLDIPEELPWLLT